MNLDLKQVLPWLGTALAGALLGYLVPFFLSSERVAVSSFPLDIKQLKLPAYYGMGTEFDDRDLKRLIELTKRSEWLKTLDDEIITDEKKRLEAFSVVDDQIQEILPGQIKLFALTEKWPSTFSTRAEAFAFFSEFRSVVGDLDGHVAGEVARNEVAMESFSDVIPRPGHYKFFDLMIDEDGDFRITNGVEAIPLVWSRRKGKNEANLRKIYGQIAVGIADGRVDLLNPLLPILAASKEQIDILQQVQLIVQKYQVESLKRDRIVLRVLVTNSGGRGAALVPEAKINLSMPTKKGGSEKFVIPLVAIDNESKLDLDEDSGSAAAILEEEPIVIAPNEAKVVTFIGVPILASIGNGNFRNLAGIGLNGKLTVGLVGSSILGNPVEILVTDIKLQIDDRTSTPYRRILGPEE